MVDHRKIGSPKSFRDDAFLMERLDGEPEKELLGIGRAVVGTEPLTYHGGVSAGRFFFSECDKF